jgi:hypothetical protein
MTRGYEPYENEYFDPGHKIIVINRLQAMIFSNLKGGRLD